MSTAVARRARILVALLLIPSTARAHTSLRASDPAKNARLAVAPTRITLWFTARPQLAFSKLTLTGPSGAVALGPLVTDTGDVLRADIMGVLAPLAARGVPISDAGDRARRLGMSALVLYGVAVILRAYNESVAVHGVADALVPDQVVPMLTSTIWGTGWLFGVVGAALVAAGWTISRRSVGMGTPLALTGALGLVLSPALSGHAAASRHFVVSVVLDVVHVTAA